MTAEHREQTGCLLAPLEACCRARERLGIKTAYRLYRSGWLDYSSDLKEKLIQDIIERGEEVLGKYPAEDIAEKVFWRETRVVGLNAANPLLLEMGLRGWEAPGAPIEKEAFGDLVKSLKEVTGWRFRKFDDIRIPPGLDLVSKGRIRDDSISTFYRKGGGFLTKSKTGSFIAEQFITGAVAARELTKQIGDDEELVERAEGLTVDAKRHLIMAGLALAAQAAVLPDEGRVRLDEIARIFEREFGMDERTVANFLSDKSTGAFVGTVVSNETVIGVARKKENLFWSDVLDAEEKGISKIVSNFQRIFPLVSKANTQSLEALIRSEIEKDRKFFDRWGYIPRWQGGY